MASAVDRPTTREQSVIVGMKNSMKAFKSPPLTVFNETCVTCTQPHQDGETIGFTEYWKVVLHPDQSGLGSCLVAPLRHVARMADLSGPEWHNFSIVIRELEPALEKTFGAALVNLSYQRNWAYRKEKPDPPFKDGRPNPHVHWHVIPRYEKAVVFEQIEFTDPSFGEPFEWRHQRAPSVRQKILAAIQSNLSISYIEK